MQNINFYNLSDINCWIVYQMPFEKDEKSNEKVLPHQEFCIKNNIFAMGWGLNKNFFNKNFGEMLDMPIVTKIIIKDIWVLIKLLKEIQVLKKH